MARPSVWRKLGILLWHHFCYYKRHRVMLVLNLFLPALIALMIYLVNSFDFSKTEVPESPSRVTNGWLLPYSASEFRQKIANQKVNRITDRNETKLYRKCSAFFNNDEDDPFIEPIDEMDEKILKCMDAFEEMFLQRNMGDFGYQSEDNGVLMESLIGDILYFPNTSKTVEAIAKNMRESLSDFFRVHSDVAKKTNSTDMFEIIQSCFSDPSQRVKGFKSEADAIHYARTHLIPSATLEGFCDKKLPRLWGIVDFEDTDSQKKRYSIIFDHQDSNYLLEKGFQLQSVVESAFLSFFGKGINDLKMETRSLPNKCWIRPSAMIANVSEIALTLLVVMGFLAFALNSVNLMVTEKVLRLREYMAIMGVNSLFLKFSWFLFYAIYLVVCCAIVAILLGMANYLPSTTSYCLIYWLLLSFSLARLAYSFLLAAILNKNSNITAVVTTVDSVVWVITIFVFRNLAALNGARLIFVRLASFHFVVPACLGCFYFAQWSSKWIGLSWNHVWISPYESDEYGGLGMCCVHLFIDMVLYFVVSGYVENVFPGEFGQKQPFYFCFLPHYWRGAKNSGQSGGQNQGDGSEMLNGAEGVKLQDLSKVYPGGFQALYEFTETFRSNQITAFLGKNGAGKSTTMNMMVGLIHPTSGSIRYNHLDISTDLATIRDKIGFVPQYDILYPDLTLMEHTKFYGWLKGLSNEQIDEMTRDQLQKLDLHSSVNNVALKLSGGQRRKLSLLIAYIGDPEYVILDEPTSGVDPFSARNIWDTILSHRKDTTTILSTHQMDEADLLADWITIIESGQFQCSGTPWSLKDRYGRGFRIVVSTGNADANQTEEIKATIMDGLQLSSELVSTERSDIICKVPKETVASAAFVETLKKLEHQISEMNVGASYGVTEPNLEEVFFTATSPDAQDLPKVEKSAADFKYEHLTGAKSYVQQAVGQLLKRFWASVSSLSLFMYQFVIPLMYIGLMFLIIKSVSEDSTQTNQQVQLTAPYRQNIWFLRGPDEPPFHDIAESVVRRGIGPGSKNEDSDDEVSTLLKVLPGETSKINDAGGNCSCHEYCDESQRKMAKSLPKIKLQSPSGDTVFGLNGVQDIDKWIIAANHSPEMIMGGLDYQDSVLNIYSKEGYLPAIFNAITNVLLRSGATGSSENIQLFYRIRFEEIDLNVDQSKQFSKTLMNDMLRVIFLILAFSATIKGIALYIMNEKETGLKRIQFLANANRTIYWVCNLIWDFFCYLVIMSIICIILVAVKNPFSEFVPYMLPVTIPFGIFMASHIYFLSIFFRKASFVTTFLEVLMVVFLVGSTTLSSFENIPYFFCEPLTCNLRYAAGAEMIKTDPGLMEEAKAALEECYKQCAKETSSLSFAKYINPILRFHPWHLLMEGFQSFSFLILVVRMGEMGILRTIPGTTTLCEKVRILFGGSVLQYKYFGKLIMSGVLGTILYFTVTILMEYFLPNGVKSRRAVKRLGVEPTDPDVLQEKAKTMALQQSVPLAVKEISKNFISMSRPAVDKVTFSITSPETFGLLGVNGAGKTTTFRMIAGFEHPDGGTCEIDGHDIRKDCLKAEKNIMYCPQDNILSDGLSVKRHLDIFGRFMNIPPEVRADIVQTLITEVGLDEHQDKAAGTLSGGNKRKLQLALALMGYPKMVFLDEPTTGMDPMARRQAWDAIGRAVARGSSVVLTSHSMEECEVLCHRLVIMVAGTLRCIGSVQYLKNKLGNRYTFKLRLSPPSEEDLEGIKKEVYDKYESHVYLLEQHSTMLHFEINSDKLGPLSDLFALMIRCQEKFHVQSFTVSQVTLEHVFVNMARLANEAELSAVAKGVNV